MTAVIAPAGPTCLGLALAFDRPSPGGGKSGRAVAPNTGNRPDACAGGNCKRLVGKRGRWVACCWMTTSRVQFDHAKAERLPEHSNRPAGCARHLPWLVPIKRSGEAVHSVLRHPAAGAGGSGPPGRGPESRVTLRGGDGSVALWLNSPADPLGNRSLDQHRAAG